jgi:hypothetical protein
MNQEWKEKWLVALRSGKYKQGARALRRGDDTFCCLGVLSDLVLGRDHWTLDSLHRKYQTFGGGESWPERSVSELAGITSEVAYELAAINDLSTNFNKVIKYIEANL